jgi:hypothetical protein
MAVAILLGGIGLLVAGVVIVVGAAVHAPQEQDLDEAFAEARGRADDPDTDLAPWSSIDLAAMRDDVTTIDRHDPFAMLRRVTSPISWHVPSNGSVAPHGHASEPKPIVWRAPSRAV